MGGPGDAVKPLAVSATLATSLEFAESFSRPAAQAGLERRGHVRVGLEDSLWDGPGRLAESSRVQVERLRAAAAVLYRDIATPSEARRRLALRSAERSSGPGGES